MRKALIVALLFAASTGGDAMAQVFKEPCHVDTVCSGVQKGGGRIISCLKAHKADLSEECFAALGHFMLNKKGNGGGKAAAAGKGGDDQRAGAADATQQ